MAKQSKNILRRHQSKKPMIIVLAILFVIVFLMVSYFYYRVLNYEYVHGAAMSERCPTPRKRSCLFSQL